jgi:hypothetical protein
VKNKFVMRSENNFVNQLKISTPFPEMKSIVSNFKLKIPQVSGITARFDVGTLNKNKWQNYGFKLNYVLPKHDVLKIHDVTLIVMYPLMNSSRININSRLELTKTSLHLASISIDGFNTYMKISGEMNQIGKDFDVAFNMLLRSPVIKLYVFDAYFQRKKIETVGNKISTGFLYNENHDESKVGTFLI